MNCREFRKQIEKVMAGELAPPEMKALERHAAACERCQDDFNALRGLDALMATAFRHIDTYEGFTDRVVARLEETEERTVTEVLEAAEALPASERPIVVAPAPRRWIWPAAAAASIGLAIGLAFALRLTTNSAPKVGKASMGRQKHLVQAWVDRDFIPLPSRETIRAGDRLRAPAGGPADLDLLEGGTVTAHIDLAAKSEIRVESNHRVMLLSGRAYFQVSSRTRDSPFWVIVNSGKMHAAIRVLGTAFEVSVEALEGRATQVVVTMERGKVRLYAGLPTDAAEDAKVIEAGEIGSLLADGRIARQPYDAARHGPVAAWHLADAVARARARPEPDPKPAAASLGHPKPQALVEVDTGPNAIWPDREIRGTLERLIADMRLRMGPKLSIEYDSQDARVRSALRKELQLRTRRMTNRHVLGWAARQAGLEVYSGFEGDRLAAVTLAGVRRKNPLERFAEDDRADPWRTTLQELLSRPQHIPQAELDLAEAAERIADAGRINVFVDWARLAPRERVSIGGAARSIDAHLKELCGQIQADTVLLDGAVLITTPERAGFLDRRARRYPMPFAGKTPAAPAGSAGAAVAWIRERLSQRRALEPAIGEFQVDQAGSAFYAVAAEVGHRAIEQCVNALRRPRRIGAMPDWLRDVEQRLNRRPKSKRGRFIANGERPFREFLGMLENATGLEAKIDPAAKPAPNVRLDTRGMRWGQIAYWMARRSGLEVRLEPGRIVFGIVPGGAPEIVSYRVDALLRQNVNPLERVDRLRNAWPRTGEVPAQIALIGDRLAVDGGPVAQASVSLALEHALKRLGPETYRPPWRIELDELLDRRFDLGILEWDSIAEAFQKLPPLSGATVLVSREVSAMMTEGSIHFRKMTVRKALETICKNHGLTFDLIHGAIYVDRIRNGREAG